MCFHEHVSTYTHYKKINHLLAPRRTKIKTIKQNARHNRNWKLHHDNTPVRTAFFASGLVFDDKVSNSALLPYSPEVVPLDILLFFHLKSQPKEHHFRTIDAI
ncbi:hypothetical protein TNIN_233461 [Trichonephila inaurata madagascariensis]|uniref:Transposase n=1 Tax=Trichonephila inaurata madagascariensis TaxID=2747483 RepID=A0A8X6YBA7_9ARAC|nr:hypothetical protein TNIN_233461 [Trichonephila inaurata madagascariensis]